MGAKLASDFLGSALVHVGLRVDRALVAVQNGLVGEELLALVAAEPAPVQLIQVGLVGVRVVSLNVE